MGFTSVPLCSALYWWWAEAQEAETNIQGLHAKNHHHRSNREKVLDRVRFLSILLSTSLFFLCPSLVFSKCKDRAMFPKERITKGEGKCGEKLEKKGMVWGNVRAAVGLNWRSEKYLVKLKIKVVAATVNRVFAQCCSITEGNISTESQVGLSKEACL